MPATIGTLIMGSHVSTREFSTATKYTYGITCIFIAEWLWISLATTISINAHTDYHLPFFPSNESHDYHHLKFTQCFGVLGILDYLHGTNSLFRSTKVIGN
jgi:hypothetical protein